MEDDPRQRIAELRRLAAESLLAGNDDRYLELTSEADNLIVAALADAMPEPTRLEGSAEVPEIPSAEQIRADARARDINRAFEARFGELDDRAFRDGAAIARARLHDPAFSNMSAEQFAQEIGDAVRRMHSRPSVEPERTTRSSPQQLTRSAAPESPDVDSVRMASARRYVEERIARRYR